MSRTSLIFLLAVVLLATSGFRLRCWWLCTDQTAIQNDYTEQRDICREYAQLKLDTAMKNLPNPDDEKAQKSQLTGLFAECMQSHGWTVPDGKPAVAAAAAVAAAPVVATAPAAATPSLASPPAKKTLTPEDKAFTQRSAECSFARYSASTSSIASARAQACDIECNEALKAAPDAPRPAACPSETKAGLSVGTEKE